MGKSSKIKGIKQYYDEFSKTYDIDRTSPYFSFINYLEIEKVIPLVKDKRVLEVGCGTGLLLKEVDKIAKVAIGVDISEKMLRYARSRKLKVIQADVAHLPFKDKLFDVVYSFKVLPHIPNIKEALDEIKRVTKDDGYMVLEFYNPFSIKYLVNKLMPRKVYQRFDSYKDIKNLLPSDLTIESFRGIRIFTPTGMVYRIPVISSIFKFLERTFCDSILGMFGGYFIVVLKKKG